jgi:hypothetical protein
MRNTVSLCRQVRRSSASAKQTGGGLRQASKASASSPTRRATGRPPAQARSAAAIAAASSDASATAKAHADPAKRQSGLSSASPSGTATTRSGNPAKA